VQAYGMTELSPVATLLPADDHRAGSRLRAAGKVAAHSELALCSISGRSVLTPAEATPRN